MGGQLVTIKSHLMAKPQTEDQSARMKFLLLAPDAEYVTDAA